VYNKLFTKILDSSIWLEPAPTRVVWITFLAAMDRDGYAHFSAMGNLAQRAMVTLEEAERAVAVLEAPDRESGDPTSEGRRIERVPGGWVVINAGKHRDLITAELRRGQTRERVRLHRERKRTVTPVTHVANSNDLVAPSEALSEAGSDTDTDQDHGSRESSARPTPAPRAPSLVNGRSARAHASHAWCGQRLCVPHFLHDELLGKRGGPTFRGELEQWYRATEAEFDGQPIGDRVEDFWRNRFAETWPPVTSRPSGRESVTAQAIRAGNDYLRSRKVDP
jgi:hypothetical protein